MRIIQSATPRPLNLLALGPGGLVAAASDTFAAGGGVEVWDAASGSLRHTHGVRCSQLAFSSDGGSLFVAKHERIAEIEIANGVFNLAATVPFMPRRGIYPDSGTPPLLHFAVTTSGARLLVALSWQAGAVVECCSLAFGFSGVGIGNPPLWRDDRSGEGSRISKLVVCITGRTAAFEHASDSAGRAARRVSLRDAVTGTERASIPLDAASPVRQLAFTADGAKLLVGTDSRAVHLFDAATGAPAGELVHRGRPYVTGVAVHPRGPVACARENGTVTLWDADRREQMRVLDWKAGKLVSVAFSPDGALAAAGTEDGKVVVWDMDV